MKQFGFDAVKQSYLGLHSLFRPAWSFLTLLGQRHVLVAFKRPN